LQALAEEMVDRFGPRPEAVERLLRRMELRVLAHGWGVESIHLEDRFVVMGYNDRAKMERLAKANPGRVRIADERSAYVPLPSSTTGPDAIDSFTKTLLRAE
jgi:transcription-repair coupling factor (superfamily II helicase)